MSDYSKKTVADLQEILKSRGLQHTGKKAELVARLQENDIATEAAEAAEAAAPEQKPEPTADAAPAPAPQAPAAEPAPKPAPAPAAAAAAAAAATATTSTAADASAASSKPSDPAGADPAAPSPDTTLAATTNYALNLPAESLDDEAARRQKRAERFGLNAAGANGEVDPEEAKKTARAEKFGTGATGLGKLNEALPTERIRGAKASKESTEDTVMDDPGLIRRGGGSSSRGRGGLRGRFRHGVGGGARRRRQGTPDRPTGVQKPAAYNSEKDRAAADARKKRFAQAS